MRIDVVTLFPQAVHAVTEYGVTGRAVTAGIVDIAYWNPRDFTHDKHRSVDDRPYGGGPGMLMKYEPLHAAIAEAKSAARQATGRQSKVIYLSPQGRLLDQQAIKELARHNLVLIAGRYEGIDERLIETDIDEEWSIGDYVLSGGELAAMVVIDATARLQPGSLGDEQSAQQDSFMDGLLDCPHYTRPETIAERDVPAVLLGGDHAAISQWRLQQSLGRTWQRRPDLLQQRHLSREEQRLLQEYIDADNSIESNKTSK